MTQRTIAKEVALEGIGLHTGKMVRVSFRPSDIGEGVVFKRSDLAPENIIPVNNFEFGAQKRRTTVSRNGVEIHTVEHLMAALWALGIDNVLVEVDGIEMPGCDGSALAYYDCIKSAGVREQASARKILRIREPLWYEKEDAFIGIFPGEGMTVSYVLDSPSPAIKRQALTLRMDEEVFRRDIAAARTFCLREEAEMLVKMGFGKGANTKNTLVMDKTGPVDNVLRFPDEPVRHKILDLIGDLYLAGAVEGRVIAIGSGHELNRLLVSRLRAHKQTLNATNKGLGKEIAGVPEP